MNILLFTAGILVVIFLLMDVFYTTFSLRGAGPLTAPTTKAFWNTLVALSRNSDKKPLLSNAGLLIMLQTLLQWGLLLLLGHVLIAAAQYDSLVQAQTNAPATLAEKIYVVGYTITTMGNGDFAGNTEGWKLFLSLTALNGLVVFTVALTYLVQVLSKVNSKREFAGSVSSVGSDPADLLRNSWKGGNFSSLDLLLQTWNSQITSLTQSHLSYPILHFYYSQKRGTSLPVMLCVLDEALTLLHNAVPEQQGPNAVLLQSTRNSILSFLETVQESFIQPAAKTPPATDTAFLQDCGVPVQQRTEDSQEQQRLTVRRKLLLGLLSDEGRQWSAVSESGGASS